MRGNIAKENVTAKIKAVFGEDYAGIADKKIYVWADDGGERVQIALSLTCPKTFIGDLPAVATTGDKDLDFTVENNTNPQATDFKPAEITDEEKDNIKKMMEAFNLL